MTIGGSYDIIPANEEIYSCWGGGNYHDDIIPATEESCLWRGGGGNYWSDDIIPPNEEHC